MIVENLNILYYSVYKYEEALFYLKAQKIAWWKGIKIFSGTQINVLDSSMPKDF